MANQLLLFKHVFVGAGVKDKSHGKSTPSLETLEKIADALNVSITELFVPQSKELWGHVEYKGVVYTIKSRSDLENLLKII